MPNHLPVPPELQHLIEKRETDDRREEERRSGQDRREGDPGPIRCIESVEDLEQLPLAERRSGAERREEDQRRKNPRRSTDAQPAGSDAPQQQPPENG